MMLSKCIACSLPVKKIHIRSIPTYVHVDTLEVVLRRSVKMSLKPSHSIARDMDFGLHDKRGLNGNFHASYASELQSSWTES